MIADINRLRAFATALRATFGEDGGNYRRFVLAAGTEGRHVTLGDLESLLDIASAAEHLLATNRLPFPGDPEGYHRAMAAAKERLEAALGAMEPKS